MESDEGSPIPDKFRSLPGCAYPLYHVLADVGEFAGGEVLPSSSSSPLALDGMILRKNGRLRILLVNLTDKEQQVQVAGSGLPVEVSVKSLDESCAARHRCGSYRLDRMAFHLLVLRSPRHSVGRVLLDLVP